MNEKGMIISSLLYAILALFILVLFSIILMVGIRKNIFDNTSKQIANQMDRIPPIIKGPNKLFLFTGQTLTSAVYDIGLTAEDNMDGDVTDTITCTKPATKIICTAYDSGGNFSKHFEREVETVSEITYSGANYPRTFIPLESGTYQFELWGAAGGSSVYNSDGTGAIVPGGAGAYVTGDVSLTSNNILYIYVGKRGEPGKANIESQGGYNGGGSGGKAYQGAGAGGGATDVRTVSGSWDETDSLISRIIVAGAGAGASNWTNAVTGGAGGGLLGVDGSLNVSSTSHTLAVGGSQSFGGSAATGGTAGSFGIGGDASIDEASGGGAGFYGGGSGGYVTGGVSSGAGGSSFISGHSGCMAVNERGLNTGQSEHYSGIVFTNTQILAGTASVPTYDGTSTMTGNDNDGFIKITLK